MKTRTQNGDLTYTTTGSANLDFFGQLASKRCNRQLARKLFELAYQEDVDTAIMNLIHLRDINEGYGERETYRAALGVLSKKDPALAIALSLKLAQEGLGRFDDVLSLVDTLDRKNVLKLCNILHYNIERDETALDEGRNNVSLLAKWLPSLSSSNEHKRNLARTLCNRWEVSQKDYRKLLSKLRKHLSLVETSLCKKDYVNLDYGKLPSRAFKKYTKAFKRHDLDKYTQFVDSLANNKKVASKLGSNLAPYEIFNMCSKDEKLANTLWDAIPREDDFNFLVVRDGSGSMMMNIQKSSATVLDVASSLTILAAEQLKGNLKNKFITFSKTPRLVDLSDCKTILEKRKKLWKEREVENTDIEKVYKLIYKTVDKKEHLPKSILILSDMNFDDGTTNPNVSVLDHWKSEYLKKFGVFPKIVWWNLNTKEMISATTDERGNIFVSGFNSKIFGFIKKALQEDNFRPSCVVEEFLKEKYSSLLETIKRNGRHLSKGMYLPHDEAIIFWENLDKRYQQASDDSSFEEGVCCLEDDDYAHMDDECGFGEFLRTLDEDDELVEAFVRDFHNLEKENE